MAKVNPRIDLAFKKIFGVEENKDLLISLVNSIVSDEDQVADITLLNPYNQKSFRKDKLSILDIKAEGCDGKKFNIEIQLSDEADYDKRALYYWAKLYSDQLKESEDYSNLSKVIGIHILNFTSILGAEKYHNVFRVTEKETGQPYFKDLELHTIELIKFTDQLDEKHGEIVSKIQTALDMWSAFLARHELVDEEKLAKKLGCSELEKAIHILEVMNFTEDEREAYEDHLKWLRIETNTLKKAKEEGIEEGRKEGIEEGRKEGIEEGRKEGIEEGRKQEKLQIALVLLGQLLSIDQISKATGLTPEEIESLQE